MMSTKSDVIRNCFAAYRNRDRKALENAFAEDFTFTSPYDDHISKVECFQRCWPVSASGKMTNEIECIFEQDNAAFVTYRCAIEKGEMFRNTEFFVFDGGRVKSIDVYFGASYADGKFVKQKEQ
jgi:ketosteroid isomerase-like protein